MITGFKIWTSFSNRFLLDKLGQNWGHFDIIYKVKYALRISFQKHVSFLIRFALVLDSQSFNKDLIGHGRSFWILPPYYYLTGGQCMIQKYIK